MDPISNVDRLVFLLRQRLMARASPAKSAKLARAVDRDGRASGSVSGTQALSGVHGVSDRALRRALVQDILSEYFGAELLNDAKFQQVVEQVTSVLEAEEATATMLARAVRDMRAAAAR